MTRARTKARVIVLNDDPDLVEAICEHLEENGFETAKSLTRSISSVEESRADIALIDAPPGSEGTTINFVQRLRLNKVTHHVAVVISTSNIKIIDPELLRERRIAVLIKPFDPSSLIETVEQVLIEARAAQSAADDQGSAET